MQGYVDFIAHAVPLTYRSDFAFECISEYLFSTYMCTIIRNKVVVTRMQKSEVDLFFFILSRGFCLSESLLTQLLLRLIKVILWQVFKQA